MDRAEDHTEPVSKVEVDQAINNADERKLHQLVERVLRSIGEKRDSYNGVVSSMIYLIECKSDSVRSKLRNELLERLTQRPMSYAGRTFLSKALYRLVSDQPLFIQELFECVIFTSDHWKQRILPDESQIIKLQIIALKAIKQAEHSKLGRPTALSSEFIDCLCEKSVKNGDDATKIDTLNLVLESRSTTRILGEKELNIYRAIFIDAICLQDAALRQIFIALTNKLFKRLKDSYKLVMRDNKKFNDIQREEIANRYRDFINWLIQTCLDSNYCNAYFGSFVLTISTLKLIILHVTFSEPGLPIEPSLNSRRCYDSILSCLSDSFEENKVLALDLLMLLPYNEVFFSDSNIKTFHDIAYSLIDSINPAHSLTCQYVFKLLISLEEKKAVVASHPEITKNRLLLRHLTNLIDQVEESIKSAEDNFTMALKGKPVYPKLTCIRSLLEEVEIGDLDSDRQHWSELCHRVVSVSIEACKAVSSIVCNLNPETIGHLPMDLKPVDPVSLAKSFNLSINIEDPEYNTISSQMLLISGWKTIKECSLSLGTLCQRFWWPRDGIKVKKEKFPGLITQPVLASDDLMQILDYFDYYLRNLRHRGAFEQAYNGFIMVTRRIWHDLEFRELLIKNLHEIMDDFKTDNSISCDKAEHLKAYVTRRSAGLPFVVQAILISEHKQESKILDWVMGSLFGVLNSKDSEEYQRIHCMNILRALIKEHNLGEKVLKHVGQTLSITLKAFRCDSFPIRNCANMLLKAVVDRTFGVNRLKEEIHRRNQLSFEKFFSDFPNLHHELIEYLKTGVNDKRYLPSIHSVLIVLSRLKASTSPSEDYTFDKVIKPYIETTMKWALNCPDYKLREVAAKICIQLCNYSTIQISPSAKIDELKDYLIENLRNKSAKPNQYHGRLAVVKFLIESDSQLFHQIRGSILEILRESYEVLNSRQHASSLKLSFITTLESWHRVMPIEKIAVDRHDLIKALENFINEAADDKHPHSEQTFYKLVSFVLNEIISGWFYLEATPDSDVIRINSRIAKLVLGSSARNCTLNFQAAVIRLLRQLHYRDEDIIDELHSVLDLDSTAVHETPFDKLKYRKDEGLECAKLEAHLNRSKPLASPTSLQNIQLLEPYIEGLIDFSKFDEFKPILADDGSSYFSPERSNTPRSIELLAYACKTKGFLDFKRSIIWKDHIENEASKLRSICQFISNITDCDVKSLAVILSAQILQQVDLTDRENVAEIDSLSVIISELADGHHTFVVRKACCHFLKITFNRLIESIATINARSLVNFISSLIKLTKDSESELRSISFKVVSSLSGYVLSLQSETLDLFGSRLDPLIRLIVVGGIFDPCDVEQSNQLLDLLCQIIFDHGKNHSYEIEDDKERLFDKTKLNTFADHVAATKSALRGLYRFFEEKRSKISLRSWSLNSIKLPKDVLAELDSGLKLTKPSEANSTGDYSWRLRQQQHELPKNAAEHGNANHLVIDKLLQEIFDSFEYFSRGYWNILTDTEYIYYELSLYRRLAFVKFVLDCIEHSLEYESSLARIKEQLQRIVSYSCATTILTKCIDLLECNQATTD